MKTLTILMISIFLSTTVGAQDLPANQVPANIRTNFELDFKKATHASWEQAGSFYKVDFQSKDLNQSVWYAKDGCLIKQQTPIAYHELPQAVKETLTASYPNIKFNTLLHTKKYGNSTYSLILESAIAKKNQLVFNYKGDEITQ
ncbi:putative PepSY-like beta-lactamase-inhibitor [Leeuwenhoekiella aestuarii]|uniref:PepSY-like domain-containing protein n=1 Tax=Leeuwenhoekiella aestuarii TaxID=2249426 RepID=UPI000FFE7B70|nr:PepSY-like domain-containing protein [Leeuwenhoekiella aestuarii]RXG15036.1 putative PepSY-like beta-lactamase-inhibitor [Leeuwenhoekiella aestuarii]